uniref:Uncharacterized protein n=1 Tax=Cucumis melo TaxID=3656 RepID=A0A9I9DY43_CUCME
MKEIQGGDWRTAKTIGCKRRLDGNDKGTLFANEEDECEQRTVETVGCEPMATTEN